MSDTAVDQMYAIAEQVFKRRTVFRRGDDQNFAYPRQHQSRQRIIDHRLVIDRQQLLGGGKRDRMKPRSRTAGQYDAFHLRVSFIPASTLASDACHAGG